MYIYGWWIYEKLNTIQSFKQNRYQDLCLDFFMHLFSLFPISATIIATVLCDPYFYGEDCSKVCSRYVNGSHGRCNATGQLQCDQHYFGLKCTIFCVDKNNGTCNKYGDLICDDHFYGNECSRYCVDTTHGNCSVDGYLKCQDGK